MSWSSIGLFRSQILCSRLNTFSLASLINKKLDARSPAAFIRNISVAPGDDVAMEKKKKVRVIKVNVILPDKSVSSMTKDEALKWAKRRDLSLSRVKNPPKHASFAERDVYEMLTKSQLVQVVTSRSRPSEEDHKDKKTLTLSPNIAEHDFNIKLKQLHKWLKKNHLVCVIVSDDGTGVSMQEKCARVKEEVKDMCTVKMTTSKRQTLMNLTPVVKTEATDSTDPSEKES